MSASWDRGRRGLRIERERERMIDGIEDWKSWEAFRGAQPRRRGYNESWSTCAVCAELEAGPGWGLGAAGGDCG
jgi:hypothetical protein